MALRSPHSRLRLSGLILELYLFLVSLGLLAGHFPLHLLLNLLLSLGLLDLVAALLEQLRNSLVLVIGPGHARLKIGELVENLLRHSILVIVFDNFKVELATGKFDVSLQLLLKNLLLQLRSEHHGVELRETKLGMGLCRHQLLSLMVLLLSIFGVLDLDLRFVEPADSLGFFQDLLCLVHESLVRLAKLAVSLLLLHNLCVYLVV